ncbi:MAG: phosphotransferase family protein [Actinomycetota bacterium]|nr:phosphotransferase family protein [Actinomycetota bacterium]
MDDRQATTAQGADPRAVGPYLAEVLGDPEWEQCRVELLSGGKSNLTYSVTAGERELILRRPPLGHVLPTAHDMAREYTVLEALGRTDVPVPQPFHLCRDTSVIGAPFYVMERLRGLIARGEFPPGYADDPSDARKIGEAVIDTLISIHAVDWNAVGLQDFGHPQGFLARQLRRWREQWERSKTNDMPAMDDLLAALEDKIPESQPPTIVHGDFRTDNCVLDAETPGRVVGVLDWEMSTIGDPLADLGLTMCYWTERRDDEQLRSAFRGITVTATEGFPTREDLVDRYATITGRDVSDISWYWAFGFFKLAVVLEGIHARYLQGKTVGSGFERVGESVAPLVMVSSFVLDRGEVAPIG